MRIRRVLKGVVMQLKRSGWWVLVLQAGLLAWAGSAAAAKVYVADEDGNTVSVIEPGSFTKVGSVAVGRGPHNVQVSPDGKFAWVTNND